MIFSLDDVAPSNSFVEASLSRNVISGSGPAETPP